MTNWLAAIAFILASLVTTSTRAQQPQMLSQFGETMGSTYSVKIFDPPADFSADWKLLVDRELRLITDHMSTYTDNSDISRFNASQSTDWFEVSPDLATVVARAIEISKQSNGVFDITLLPVVKAWSFGPGKKRQVPPSDDELAALKGTFGYQHLDVRLEPAALRKDIPGLQIDLNAIAPGYAADVIVELLQRLGAKNLFIDVGGEIRATGDKGGESWQVGIQRPDVDGYEAVVAYPLHDRAMATSGDYRSFFEYQGKRYSHTIDPRTMRPITHNLASVTVLADDCMTADATATTLSVMGADEGVAFAKQHQLDTLFMTRDADGKFTVATTGRFDSISQSIFDQTGSSDQAMSSTSMNAFMPIAIVCLCVFGLAVVGLAVGVLMGRRPISGSCGGLANKRDADGNVSCGICSNPDNACKELRERMKREVG